MTVNILNFALGGLVAGAAAAMLVALLAMRWPRFAATAGTLAFPIVLAAPLVRSAAEIAVDDRRADAMFSLVCAIVSALLILRELYGHVEARSERRRWTLAPGELRQSVGIDALFVDPGADAATHGVFRRAVVVPSVNVPRSVLLHEHAHYVWHDAATAAARRLVRAAFWFHLGLWILERAIRQASELAADAMAARATPAAAYAATLVAAARSSAVPAFGAASARELEERVRTLLGRGRGRFAAVRVVVLAGALAAVPLVPQFVEGNEVIVRRVVVIR